MPNIKVPQTGKTFWGDEVVSFKDMLRDASTEQAVKDGLIFIFGEIGLTKELLLETIDFCINTAKTTSNLLDYEQSVRKFLEQSRILEKYYESKKDRSSTRSDKVSEHLLGKTVLDLGCGSGKIGAVLSEKDYVVTLADVYKNHNISTLPLDFYQITDGQPLPFENDSFDNVLMLSMLHHTQDPIHTIDECKRVLKRSGRLHLIETLYGIPTEMSNGSYGTNDLPFRVLSTEQQRRVTMFFDYFANHILDGYTENSDKYIPVPFNFTTPDNLEQIFSEKMFKMISKEYLGIYPFSYVYHVHFVFSKE